MSSKHNVINYKIKIMINEKGHKAIKKLLNNFFLDIS